MAGEQAKQKKRALLEDSDSDSDDGGAAVASSGFKVNQEFAKRFEHNKKREEQHRLEEKQKNDANGRGAEDDDSSSSNETEDEDGFLATEDLDVQISATLQAIRNKDPRVYDKNVTFYKPEKDAADPAGKEKKEKPVYLRDYHREKLLAGDIGASDDEEDAPRTYSQEQEALKKSIVSEINAVDSGADSDEDSDGDAFMKKKNPSEKLASNGVHASRAPVVRVAQLDISNANKNPETFLSNFMAARAWVPQDGSKWEAFESDDGEDDNNWADEFEQAYNMRFEDPEKSNEVLKSYARDVAAARSVRREEKTGRKKQREIEKERKEEEKQKRKDEKARLKKFKLDETSKRLQKVKQAAGATGKTLTDEEWIQFLDDAWENDKWEDEMKKRFGDEYYAVDDDEMGRGDKESDDEDGDDATSSKKKKKTKKPKWDDDIDIKDIIPDFEDKEATAAVALGDSDSEAAVDKDEEQGEEEEEEEEDGDSRPSKKRKTTDHKLQRIENQKKARQERSKLEALVGSKLELTHHDLLRSEPEEEGAPVTGRFRYRETSPQSFGMTARDILLAPSDQALNEYAGLKKLATFRDVEKKRRDKKTLGKKARLRQWRRDVFGREFEREGPTYGFERVLAPEDAHAAAEEEQKHKRRQREPKQDGNVVGEVGGSRKKKKRKRSQGDKAAVAAEA